MMVAYEKATAVDPFVMPNYERTPTDPNGAAHLTPRPAQPVSATARWRALLRAPRALAVLYIIKLLFSFAHFSASIVLTLWLSAELGLSDSNAGWAYGAAGLFATLWGVLCGALIDRAGVRRSLLAGSCAATLARVALLRTQTPATACVVLWVLMPLADALGIPVMSIGVKRCVDRTRATEGTQIDALAFALFYSAQNVAALAAGLAVDALRARTAAWAAPLALLGAKPTAFRAVFLAGALATALSAVLVLLFLDDVDEGVVRDAPQADGVFDAVRVVWKEPRFRRFARLALILLGVSMIYRHLDNTLPKYMVRVFGPKAPYGEYYAIEPLFVVFAVPIFGTLLADAPVYSVLIAGTAVAGLSPLWMCLGNKYTFVALFVITLSLGESVYSPRVYQYTMNVAHTGSEGVYSALGNAPLFATNLLAGGMSGYLLEKFVPEQGIKRPQYLWGTVALVCLTSPLLMAVFRKHVEERDVDECDVDDISAEESGDELKLSLTNTAI